MKIKMFRYTGHCSKLLLQFLRTLSFCRRICSGRLSLWTLGLDMELVARSPPLFARNKIFALSPPSPNQHNNFELGGGPWQASSAAYCTISKYQIVNAKMQPETLVMLVEPFVSTHVHVCTVLTGIGSTMRSTGNSHARN